MSPGPARQFEPNEVLARAAEAFRERGYRGTSIATLVDCMGIGRQSLYETFGDKRSLFLRAVAQYGDTVLDEVRTTLSAPGSPIENVKRQLVRWQRRHQRRGSLGCMLGVGCADFDLRDAEVAATLREHLAHIEDAFFDALVRAHAQDELPDHVDARALARTIICTSQGVALVGRVSEDGSLARDAVGGLLDLLTARATTSCRSSAHTTTEST